MRPKDGETSRHRADEPGISCQTPIDGRLQVTLIAIRTQVSPDPPSDRVKVDAGLTSNIFHILKVADSVVSLTVSQGIVIVSDALAPVHA